LIILTARTTRPGQVNCDAEQRRNVSRAFLKPNNVFPQFHLPD
jgi:hypothetical protein